MGRGEAGALTPAGALTRRRGGRGALLSYFDHFAQSRGTVPGNWLARRAMSRQFAHIQRLLPSHDSAILEIGPGHGDLADLFHQAGYHDYTVVEPNALMRDALAQLGFKTKNYLIPGLDEANGSYDAVVLFDVFCDDS